MDSLKDILEGRDFSLPDEAKAIKLFVAQKYQEDVEVKLGPQEIIVSSRSAALITNLRLNSPALIKAARTDKRIRFKIA